MASIDEQGSGYFNCKLEDYLITIRDLSYQETGLRMECQPPMERPLDSEVKKKKKKRKKKKENDDE